MLSWRKTRPPSPLRALGIQHLTFNISHLTFCVLAFLSCGCGDLFRSTPSKPQLYRVEGRVLDGVTRQGLAKVRVLLKATIPTQFNAQALSAAGSTDARGAGKVQLSSYAVAEEDGSYTVSLSEGFEIVRNATQIRLEASLPGYAAAAIDMPLATKDEPFYKAPDIFMVSGSPGPPSTLPRGVTVPGMPSQPNPGLGPRFPPPRFGPPPKKPSPSTSPWK